jgi:segregation and condensation protein B
MEETTEQSIVPEQTTPAQEKPSQRIITQSTAQELDDVFVEKEKENEEKIEASLFIAGKYLTLQDLIMLTDVNPIMLKETLQKLEKKYSTGAIKLLKAGESWKMDVAEKYHYIINKLATGAAEFTKAEQETLAVIAYKQPIKQSVVIKIRGNKAYDHIKKFTELGLVQAKRIGHTNELSLSSDFYDYFHVQEKESEEINTEKDAITHEANSEGRYIEETEKVS